MLLMLGALEDVVDKQKRIFLLYNKNLSSIKMSQNLCLWVMMKNII